MTHFFWRGGGHRGPTSMGNPTLGFSSIFKLIGTACYRRLSNSICEWYCNLLLNSIHSLLIEIFMMNIISLSFNWWIIQKFSAQYCLAKDMKHTLLYAVALNMAVQRHLGAFLKTLLFLSYWVTIQIFLGTNVLYHILPCECILIHSGGGGKLSWSVRGKLSWSVPALSSNSVDTFSLRIFRGFVDLFLHLSLNHKS